MATYLQLFNLQSPGSDFHKRVTTAIVRAANGIRAEPGTTPNHDNRVQWAKYVIQGQAAQDMASRMMWRLLENNALADAGDAATNNQIQIRVDAVIDDFARQGGAFGVL